MKKGLFYLATIAIMFTGCLGNDFSSNEEITKKQIEKNVQTVFGTTFDPNHDWCTTTSGTLTVNNIPTGTDRIQLLAYLEETDTTTSLTVLNEAEVNGQSSIKLAYDIPSVNKGMFVMLFAGGSYTAKAVTSTPLNLARAAKTRGTSTVHAVPSVIPIITDAIPSYASDRGWLPGQVLYEMDDYSSQAMVAEGYSPEYELLFRSIIFSYFKNGRQYNNLPLIEKSGYFNESVYPITTGKDPIIISPVYKSDKAKTYGNEIWNSDLYYYYFKESDLAGKDAVEYLNSLPKYKAIPFNQHFGDTEDDVISKRSSYALVYWGDGTPEIGTTGSYQFPEGYKIGFMVRAKTTHDNKKKQGELYGDGRLNNNINGFGNFTSSKLGVDGPRMGWITVEGRMLLCVESGTDSDFNDIIIEVEGGVEPIINIPEFDVNSYTFCFEDTQLGDYDMNDVVIKASRKNETTVEYRVVACGAFDELKIMNINGQKINSNTEVHSMFGANIEYINTQVQNYDPVVEEIKVDKSFSFLNEDTQPYIYDVTTGLTVKLSKKGEDPHGIMIPNDFKYPLERVCIKNAYLDFNNWGENPVLSTNWYKFPTELTF